MVVPVGVLAALPGQQPYVARVRAVQRQVPADIGIVHDQVGPELGAGGDRQRDGPQLGRRQAPGRPDEAVQRIKDCLPPLGAHAPAVPEAGAGAESDGAGRPGRVLGVAAAGTDNGDRQATSLGKANYTPAASSGRAAARSRGRVAGRAGRHRAAAVRHRPDSRGNVPHG